MGCEIYLTYCYRYAFRSTEKVALQEIGPRFTLKLRSLKKGIPAVQQFGEAPKPLEFDAAETAEPTPEDDEARETKKVDAPKQDEFLWVWKVRGLILLAEGIVTDLFHPA